MYGCIYVRKPVSVDLTRRVTFPNVSDGTAISQEIHVVGPGRTVCRNCNAIMGKGKKELLWYKAISPPP